MLFYLDDPTVVLAVAIALLVGTVAHGVVQTLVARALGDRLPHAAGRASADPRRHLEPFGVVVMLIAGIGWGKPVPLTEPRFAAARPRYLLALVSGALTNLAIAVAALGAYAVAYGGPLRVFPSLPTEDPLGPLGTDDFGADLLSVVVLVNVLLAVLSLVPLPPFDGARILWALAPRTPGWQKARYHLEEQNVGLALSFALLIPLFGGRGLLLRIAVAIGRPLLDVLAGLFGV